MAGARPSAIPPFQGGGWGACYPGLTKRRLGSASPAPGFTIQPFQGQERSYEENSGTISTSNTIATGKRGMLSQKIEKSSANVLIYQGLPFPRTLLALVQDPNLV